MAPMTAIELQMKVTTTKKATPNNERRRLSKITSTPGTIVFEPLVFVFPCKLDAQKGLKEFWLATLDRRFELRMDRKMRIGIFDQRRALESASLQ